MTEFDDVLKPKNMLKREQAQGGESPTERDEFTADNITATLTISRAELTEAMNRLYILTNADKFSTAANLVWYKFDPTKDKRIADQMAMLTTLHRCELDGTIKPPVSLNDYYREVNNLDKINSNKPRL